MMGYKTILHIDDGNHDIIFFTAAEHLTGKAGCFSFTDAGKALHGLISGKMIPDAVFLHINTPVINGRKFLDMMRDNNHLQDIPVILLSTSSDSCTIDQLKNKNYGASGFLTKPVVS